MANDSRHDQETITENGNISFERLAIFASYVLMVILFPLSIMFCFVVVSEFERIIVFRLGRLRSKGSLGPGLIFILPCVDSAELVDLRITTLDIPPQEILTKDSVTVHVDAVIYYHVFDPLSAIIEVHDYSYSTSLMGATILRNVLGTKALHQILTDRKSLAINILKLLDDATDPWGIKVERVEITDVKLPRQMQRAMAAEAEASREAKAKIIAADGELNASKALKEAADVLIQNSLTIQLRYLQTLGTITSERRCQIIFPVPIDILPPLAQTLDTTAQTS